MAQETSASDHNDDNVAEQDQSASAPMTSVLRERAFFFGVLALLILLTLILVWPFLAPILFALAAVVIISPIYNWFLSKKWLRGSSKWAVAFTIIASILLIAVPLMLFASIAINQATSIVRGLPSDFGNVTFQDVRHTMDTVMTEVAGDDSAGGEMLTRSSVAAWWQEMTDAAAKRIQELIVVIAQTLPSVMVNSVIILAILMVLLPVYRQPNRGSVGALVPLPPEITELYLDKVQLMMRAMFMGTFIIAFAQGAAMGIVLWIAGVPYSVLLALVSMVLSLLPIIGVSLVAWPVAILLFLVGNVWQAIFVIAMLILVVGNIDAILRPMLIPKDAHLNAALTLLAVFGGIHLLGLVGFLYGPVIIILLVTSIDVYSKYMLRSDLKPYMDEDGTISLRKLGLRPKADSNDAESTGLFSMANRALRGLWSRSEEDGEKKQAA